MAGRPTAMTAMLTATAAALGGPTRWPYRTIGPADQGVPASSNHLAAGSSPAWCPVASLLESILLCRRRRHRLAHSTPQARAKRLPEDHRPIRFELGLGT